MQGKNEAFVRLAQDIEVWSRNVTNYTVREAAKRWVKMLMERGGVK